MQIYLEINNTKQYVYNNTAFFTNIVYTVLGLYKMVCCYGCLNQEHKLSIKCRLVINFLSSSFPLCTPSVQCGSGNEGVTPENNPNNFF